MFTVRTIGAKTPQENCEGQWRVCSPQTGGNFSAAAYFFGRELRRKLKVPVGLINSSYGGTPIEAWTSLKVHEAIPELKPLLEKLKQQTADFASGKAQIGYLSQLRNWELAAAKAKADKKPFNAGKPQPPQDPAVSPWAPACCYNAMISPLVPYAIRGGLVSRRNRTPARKSTARNSWP